MTDALDRLRAGLDTDERIARAATKLPQPTVKYPEKRPPWEPERWKFNQFDLISMNGVCAPVDEDGPIRDDETAIHIANWDPKRVLDVTDAIRKVLADYHATKEANDAHRAQGFPVSEEDAQAEAVFAQVLETLAAIYAEEEL